MKDMTGEFRFRNEGDLLVLQVLKQEYVQNFGCLGGETKEKWRDAKTEDLLNIKFYKEIDKYPEPITQQFINES